MIYTPNKAGELRGGDRGMPDSRFKNLPIESMRTIVDLASTASISRTAENLGVTAPAIGYQLSKLQDILGAPLFERTNDGYRPTPLGTSTIDYARGIIRANDQIILLSMRPTDAERIRVGLNNIFVNAFFDRVVDQGALRQLRISCETSYVLERMLLSDQLDIAVLCGAEKKETFATLAEWSETFVWCKSRSFVITPGAPIPVLGFVDCALTNLALRTLERDRRSAELVFTSTDRHALKKATKAGAGVWPIRPGKLDPALVVLGDDELPPLPPLQYGVFAKRGFAINAHRQRIIEMLARLAPETHYADENAGRPAISHA
jgi:DNA-binding transcriptional LysR family regulator